MAWEDWEGANTTTWFGNDGDFNDKVFAITGVTCDGGGVPCQIHHGAGGLRQRHHPVRGGRIADLQRDNQAERREVRQPRQRLQRDGRRRRRALPERPGLRAGEVHRPLQRQRVPLRPAARLHERPLRRSVVRRRHLQGRPDSASPAPASAAATASSVPPARSASSASASIPARASPAKARSACSASASRTAPARPARSGQVCSATGACVDSGCDTMTCGAGEVCSNGSCGDACAGAMCPGGAGCHNGQCDPPPPPGSTGTGGTTGAGGSSERPAPAGSSGPPERAAGAPVAAAWRRRRHHGRHGRHHAASGSGGTGPHQEGGVVSCSCDSGGAGPRRTCSPG